MRKTLLSTLILLALSAWVVAQQTPNSQSSPSTSQGTAESSGAQNPNSQSAPDNSQGQSSAGQNSVQGCLGGSGNNFTVTDKSGTSYQLQLPQGADASALRPHIGEEVRVEGTTAHGGNASGSASAAGQPSITVKNIYRVSPTCSAKSGAAPKQ